MKVYHEGSRSLQDKFDTRRLADRLEQTIVHDVITPDDAAFITACDFFFLATVDTEGQPACSFKGGPTGFVKVVDEHTIAFPSYDGNGMYMSAGNLLANPKLGMLFIDFEKPNRLRLYGEASVMDNDPLLTEWHEAQFVIRVAVTALHPNCPRYIPRLKRVEASPYVPKAGCPTPFANWKQIDFIRDSLSQNDLKKVEELPVITIEEFVETIK